MTKSSIILFLAVAIPACRDFGVPPTEQPPPSKYRDVVIKIGVIPGINTTLLCTDSLGTLKTMFASVEPVFLKYTVTNRAGKDQTWAIGMSNPFARFFVVQGSDTLADSYAGKAFLAIPAEGKLRAGDSLTALWRFDPAKISLPPGGYAAIASSEFELVDLGVPGDSWTVFDLSP